MRQPVYDAHMYERRNFNEGICSIYADRLNPLGTGGGNNAHVPCKLQRGPGEGWGEEVGKYTPEVEFKRQNHSTGFSSGMFFSPGRAWGIQKYQNRNLSVLVQGINWTTFEFGPCCPHIKLAGGD